MKRSIDTIPLNTAEDVYRRESDREYLKDLNLLKLVTFGVSWIAFCPVNA